MRARTILYYLSGMRRDPVLRQLSGALISCVCWWLAPNFPISTNNRRENRSTNNQPVADSAERISPQSARCNHQRTQVQYTYTSHTLALPNLATALQKPIRKHARLGRILLPLRLVSPLVLFPSCKGPCLHLHMIESVTTSTSEHEEFF